MKNQLFSMTFDYLLYNAGTLLPSVHNTTKHNTGQFLLDPCLISIFYRLAG